MKILIYEDNKYSNLYPLSLLRGVYDIRIGANTIKERIENITDKKFEIHLHCRKILNNYLHEVHKNKVNEFDKDDYLLLNGRVIFSKNSMKYLISEKEKNSFYIFNNTVVAAFVSKDRMSKLSEFIGSSEDLSVSDEFFSKLQLKQIIVKENFEAFIINYPWDILKYILHGGLNEDFNYLSFKDSKFLKLKSADNFINHKKILISKSAKMNSNIVLDASDGSIVINDNVTIEPFCFIKGPVFIGKNTLVKSGTKIYGPAVIGEYSKVAGEIAESVFHSYVNKQHDGFIGHSYICPFVNLGADTVTSDLKNNYSGIKMNVNGNDTDTGMQFLGSILGDHTKTSINTMLNTGTVAGIFANIFGGGFPQKNIGSFAWYDSGKTPVKYDFEKAIATAKIVMERRGVILSKNYEDLVKTYF